MIIDSHFYCFNAPDDPRGYASAQDHLNYAQLMVSGHHQPAIRLRDRKHVSSQPVNPSGKWDPTQVPNVNLRVDRKCGRILWTIDGEDHTKYTLPPNLPGFEYTPHNVISELDYCDVDMALLHVDPTLVRDPAQVAEYVRAYPNRLRAMTPVDEWRIKDEMDKVIAEVEAGIKKHGLHAIKIHPCLFWLMGPEPWDGPSYRPFWDAVTKLNVPIFFTLGCGYDSFHRRVTPDEARAGYLDEQRMLIRWMERYPDNVCSMTHGFPYRLYLDGDRITVPDEIWEPFENPNCNMEVSLPVRIGDKFDYPWRETLPFFEQMVERVGADHLLWGTDMPFQNRFCTFRQSRNYIDKYATFLTPHDRAMILGGTAARILKIK